GCASQDGEISSSVQAEESSSSVQDGCCPASLAAPGCTQCEDGKGAGTASPAGASTDPVDAASPSRVSTDPVGNSGDTGRGPRRKGPFEISREELKSILE